METLTKNLAAIIDIARLAPSVHNTQPWRVHQDGNQLKVTLDIKYILKDGDPTGRQTIIGLGIFCEAIAIASAAYGLRASEPVLGDKSATLSFTQASPTVDDQIDLLKLRHSDRSLYQPADVPASLADDLQSLIADNAITVWVVSDRQAIDSIADLTSHGINLALSSPDFRNELSQYLVLPKSSKKRGIAVNSLYIPKALAVLQPRMLRHGIGIGKEAILEKKRWVSASADIILTAPGDMPKYWFKTGRAYLRVSLELAKRGYAQATSAAVVEASNYHDDVESLLGTEQRILSLLRIGTGSLQHHYSPRIAVEDILV